MIGSFIEKRFRIGRKGAITKDDLEGFSEDLRDTVEAYTNRRFLDEQDQ